MSSLFGGGAEEPPKPVDPNKAAKEAADAARRKRLGAQGYRSTILTSEFMPQDSPTLKQYLGE